MKYFAYAISLLSLSLLMACNNKRNNDFPQSRQEPDTASAKIVAWVTTKDASKLLERSAAVPFSGTSNKTTINIDTSQRFQEMDGFGYTLTGGSAYVINRMDADAKRKLLHELFSDDENSLDINFLRISIGASDLDASVFSYDDVPAGQTDPTLAKFSLEPDKDDLIPLLKEILAIDPKIKIMGSPWSPPVWMKDNGSSVGGSLKPEYYAAYARYFVKYVQGMKEEGIPVYAITPQNEPLNPDNNPSLLMLAEQQADFIKNHLGPAFRDAGIDTKIIVYDHNCDRPDYPLTILNDPAAKEFVDGSAFHLYAGEIDAMSQVRNAHPDKNIYFTEQYTAIASDFGGDLQWHIKNLIVGAPRNWSKTVLEWNLANDASYGPHTPGGCTTCKGALTISGSGVQRNVAYYIIAHASRFVPAGSVRVGSNVPAGLPNVCFVTPEGNAVLIVLNEGDGDVLFDIKVGEKVGGVSLPAGAVGTFELSVKS
jgi:glucosylceramidase